VAFHGAPDSFAIVSRPKPVHRSRPSISATRAAARVALVTCAELPDLDPDDHHLARALEARGISVEAAVWDAPVDWSAYDLAILRSPWDYPERRDEFVAWARGVPRLANRAEVVEWNTDKRYLATLAEAGVRVVPTTWVTAPGQWHPADTGEIVVKPVIGAGSRDTGRYDLARADQHARAVAHVERLVAAGRAVMVQPYLAAVDTHGETALLYFDGTYSHAIRKGAMLTGPDEGVEGLYKPEEITPREATPAERAVADAVLAALPFAVPLYARVDLLPGLDGEPTLIELELTEPSLFLAYAEGAADRLADQIIATLS
jgi:glutathione synthase/RimK-type ligase-like ATP-grasp enzyme